MTRMYRLLIPFALIGVVLMAAGLILPDDRLVYFGVVWVIVALVAFLGYKARRP